MQNIWAKVLARELEQPNSFSYKTLDVLKNMSADDFKLFEKLCSLQINNYIMIDDITYKYISWVFLLKLGELGLINLDGSTQKYYIKEENQTNILAFNKRYVIVLKNTTNNSVSIDYSIYTLTSAGIELTSVAKYSLIKNTYMILQTI